MEELIYIMRLWHKNLITYLPTKQLVGQWRECSAICGSIIKHCHVNHPIVNRLERLSN